MVNLVLRGLQQSWGKAGDAPQTLTQGYETLHGLCQVLVAVLVQSWAFATHLCRER